MSEIIIRPNGSEINYYLAHVATQQYISMDTETTGLYPYNGDKLFCITVSTLEHDFYFDFNHEQQNAVKTPNGYVLSALDRKIIPSLLGKFKGTIFAHNAKFDMHFLDKEGLDLTKFDIHCTEAIARLENNTYPNLKLAYLAKTIGLEKSKAVDEYIKRHKLYRKVRGKNVPCYNLVPLEVIAPYAMKDTHITLRLGLHQIASLKKQHAELQATEPNLVKKYNLLTLLEVEKKLTKTLFRMEKRGVRVDLEYAKEAFAYEKNRYEELAKLFKEWSGFEFDNKKETMVKAFKAAGEEVPLTEKGNPCLNKESFSKMDTPLATIVQDYRRAYLLAHTYYENFLFFADKDGIIHPNFQQGGAGTGRLSCREPNAQNIPKKGEDKSKYPVRKCFIPLKDYLWVSCDWKQVEYRLMLDYAGEMELIEMVKNGHDVHQATGELVDMVRDLAKNVNFALLYGTGDDHFAEMIHKTVMEAKRIRQKYFMKLPKVNSLIERIKRKVRVKGYVITHFGRKLRLDKNLAYRGPNYLIQGGCADIMKVAMVQIDEMLLNNNAESYMCLTVHDEPDLNILPREQHLVEKVVKIMETVYEHTFLPMGVDVEYSEKNWHELKEYKYAQ